MVWYTGEDKKIYDSGIHFRPQQKYLTTDYEWPTEGDGGGGGGGGGGGVSYGIPAASGGGNYYPGSTRQLIGDFNAATGARQKRLEDPSWLQQQINKYTGGGQRPVNEMIRGTVGNFTRRPIDTENFGLEVSEDEGQYGPMMNFTPDQRRTAGMPMGIGKLFSMMPDAYYDKFTIPEQALTQKYMGYTGPTIFGENTSGLNKDPFGINVRSGFGNYSQYAIDTVGKLDEALEKAKGKYTKNGVFDEAAYNKNTKMMRAKLNYYKNVVSDFDNIKSDFDKSQEGRKAWEEETYKELDAADDAAWGPGGSGDYDEGSGAGGTWSGPVGPQPKDKDYADPGADAEENQPSGNWGADEGTKGSWTPGGSYNQGGRVYLNLGGIASVLGTEQDRREGLRYGGLLDIL